MSNVTHKFHHVNTNPLDDYCDIEWTKLLLADRLTFGKTALTLPPWKLKRRIRRAEARIEAAYQNALMIGSMHSDNYNERVIQ